MNQKKISLIEAGMKLFAEQGYHLTSIQEIAEEAGISKGAFYLYFTSKEDFIVTAIQYFYTKLTKQIDTAHLPEKSPEDNFADQINTVMKFIFQHRNFIIMYLREDISIGDQAVQILQQLKTDNYHWLKQNVAAIYGNKIDRYMNDLVTQIEGLISGFVEKIVIDGIQIDQDRIGPYLINRLDEMVKGMLAKKEQPLITADHLPLRYEEIFQKQQKQDKLNSILLSIQQKVDQLTISQSKRAQLLDVIKVLDEKLSQPDEHKIVIQGLLAHFAGIDELKDATKKIADILHIDLLE